MSPMTSATIPVHPLPHRRVTQPALALLRTSRQGLADAAEASMPGSRFVAAHLAALRAAAAVLAVKGEPTDARGRRRPRSVWVLVTEVAPTLGEWAAYFAAGAPKRAAAEAGLPRAVTSGEADDLLRDAEIFVSVVETLLGLPVQPTLPIAG
jgi:SAV_6107-like HEPN